MLETESELKIESSKPFTCLICGNTFESIEILNAHKTKEHDYRILSTHSITSQVIRRYLKPVPRDEKFEKMNKNSFTYKSEERKHMCILCLNHATQFLCLEYDDGCTKLERYCDTHASGLETT